MTPQTRGVIYVAQGADYTALAHQSAATLRSFEPDLPIDLFTNQDVTDPVFDQVRPIPDICNRAKIAGMIETRFDQTLFLDCDTVVLSDFGDVWDVLGRFDLAITHDVRRSSALIERGWQAPAPPEFCQHNSGVMLYNRSDRMLDFLREWAALYDRADVGRDQITLRDLLWNSDLRFWVLPPEWNLRRVTELDAWEPLDAIPRILHSHQLLRHLRHGEDQISTMAEVLPLERIALLQEWATLADRVPALNDADPVERFRLARANRTE